MLTQQQKLFKSMQIAKDNGTVDNPKYLLYRISIPKNVCVGKRKSIDGILSFVKKVTGYK